MESAKQIEMQVDRHSSGRFTLKERRPGMSWTDVNEPNLFGNADPVSFYRAVAMRMASHSAQGTVILSYYDASINKKA